MSVQAAIRRKTAPDIRARKGGDPIVMLTSYHAHTAALVDRHCDAILVGDSLGNVMHGFETTVPVTLDMMILQGRAVMRGLTAAEPRCGEAGHRAARRRRRASPQNCRTRRRPFSPPSVRLGTRFP